MLLKVHVFSVHRVQDIWKIIFFVPAVINYNAVTNWLRTASAFQFTFLHS